MHALQKSQTTLWQYGGGIIGEARLIERQFNITIAPPANPSRYEPQSLQ